MATLNDPKINNGLPEGMTLNDLEIGAIIEVKYDNTHKRSIGVIVDTKKRSHRFLRNVYKRC